MSDAEMIETINLIPEALREAINGKKVAVICRARFDAKAKSKEFWQKHCCHISGIALCGMVIEYRPSGGMIEFCWIDSHTGRRADDFDTHSFSI